MNWSRWQRTAVAQRIRMVRWGAPLVIAAIVIVYQLGFARYVHKAFSNSAHFWVEIAFYSVLGPAVTWLALGRIGEWLGEKGAAERAARAHERYLASVTDASADAIVSLDTFGVIRSWNRGATSIFGYAAGEMMDRPLTRLLPLELEREQARQARHTDDTGVLRHYETERLAQDGRRVAVDITRTPLRDDAGQVVGASVIMRDITQRKAHEAVVEEERARIARDLHDGLAQSLYFLGLKLDFIRKQIPRDPQAAVDELSALKETVQANIRDVRRTIFALRPVDLDGLGFGPALRQYVREFGEQAGLDVQLNIHGHEEALPAALEPIFFRLVQESLNNTAKHAQARHAWIDLQLQPSQLARLVVRDDGAGFDPSQVPTNASGKMGLSQMRERVMLARGRFGLESAPGKGMTLRAEIPL